MGNGVCKISLVKMIWFLAGTETSDGVVLN
jgi:hypothetical protein